MHLLSRREFKRREHVEREFEKELEYRYSGRGACEYIFVLNIVKFKLIYTYLIQMVKFT